jgi:hypothetical protein
MRDTSPSSLAWMIFLHSRGSNSLCFVDFSRDFLIALWFAAHDNKGKNGKVFVLKINNIDKFSELHQV